MEKVSASVDQLLSGLRRAKPIRVRRPLTSLPITSGPAGVGTARSAWLGTPKAFRQDPEMAAEVRRQIRNIPKPLEGKVVMAPGGGVRSLENFRASSPQAQIDLESVGSFLSGESLERVKRQALAARDPIRPSPAGAKAINAVVGAHELSEISVPVRQISMTPHGHRSVRVLAHERNALRTLTGPGADEARSVMGRMRSMTGEDEHFDEALRRHFGPRAVEEYGVGSSKKMPKSMIRRMAVGVRNDAEEGAKKHLDFFKSSSACSRTTSTGGGEMTPTETAFFDELEKIAISNKLIGDRIAGFANKHLATDASGRYWNAVTADRTVDTALDVQPHLLHGNKFTTRQSGEIGLTRKVAAPNAEVMKTILKGVGAGTALGGGISATRAVKREMDLRSEETGKYSKEQIDAARKDRKKYHGARTLAGAATGGIAGGAIAHYGPRAATHVGTEMKKGVEQGMIDGVKAGAGAVKNEVRKAVHAKTKPLRRIRVGAKKAWRFLNTPIGKLIRK